MMSQNELMLNRKPVSFTPGQTILQVARENGVDIPTLCYLKDTHPHRRLAGSARGGRRGKYPCRVLCVTPAEPNMIIRTESPRVVDCKTPHHRTSFGLR
jgi:NADP-reducing hydrogenase subunit HndD